MLLFCFAVLTLGLIGFAIVLRVAHGAMRRLGLEPMSVFLFFGLAEAPPQEAPARARLRVVAPQA